MTLESNLMNSVPMLKGIQGLMLLLWTFIHVQHNDMAFGSLVGVIKTEKAHSL